METTELLKLADGTVLQESKAYEVIVDGKESLAVLIRDENYDIVSAILLLSDKEKTSAITYHYYGVDLVFEGYTRIKSISEDGYGLSAMLIREV